MKHYNEDYIEKFDENRLKNLAENYNFAIECRNTSIESAWKFAKLDDRWSYDFNIKQALLWDDIADTWKSVAKNEKAYVLAD